MAVGDVNFDLIERMSALADNASKRFEDDSDLTIRLNKVPDGARKKIMLCVMVACNEIIKTELAKCD